MPAVWIAAPRMVDPQNIHLQLDACAIQAPARGPTTGPRSGARRYKDNALPRSSGVQTSEIRPPPICESESFIVNRELGSGILTARGAPPPRPAMNRSTVSSVLF